MSSAKLAKDAADFKHVVRALSTASAFDITRLVDWREFGVVYRSMDPLAFGLGVAIALSALSWVASLLTDNYSQVDRLWTLLPPLYALHFAGLTLQINYARHGWSGLEPRLCLMVLLPLMWGARLSYNFYRKGGYNMAGEDYRWPIIKAMLPKPAFQLLNLVFIAFIQNMLLYGLLTPAYVAARAAGHAPLNAIDGVATSLFLLFFVGETIADEQMWAFQSEKHRRIKAKIPLTGEYKVGFLRTGLFRYSRHPNFFCEQCIWFSYYLFSVAASGVLVNWTLMAPVLLTQLFQGSTMFTEHITRGKYPRYGDYCRTTSQLIPFLPPKFEAWEDEPAGATTTTAAKDGTVNEASGRKQRAATKKAR